MKCSDCTIDVDKLYSIDPDIPAMCEWCFEKVQKKIFIESAYEDYKKRSIRDLKKDMRG